MSQRERGIFVVVEGIDGTGKSTQVRMLAGALRAAGEDPLVSREPTDGRWGRKIRESATTGRMSAAEELRAFIEDRTEHVNTLIRPALDAGRIVILDRYYYSTIAYQGSRGANVEVVKAEMEARFPRPDVVFLLDLDPRLAVQRISEARGEDPNAFEGLDALAQVREVFNSLNQALIRVDAGRPPEVVHREIVSALASELRAAGRAETAERLGGL